MVLNNTKVTCSQAVHNDQSMERTSALLEKDMKDKTQKLLNQTNN